MCPSMQGKQTVYEQDENVKDIILRALPSGGTGSAVCALMSLWLHHVESS